MKLITRDTDYAIRALCYIARHKNRRITVPELFKALKIPRPFLRKILQVLNKEGILKSYKGQGGGFSLGMTVNRIFLVDLIEIFQGPFRLNECFFKKSVCPNLNNCPLNKKIEDIERYVISQLKAINIKYLLK
jgi:Rrf2 family protein